MSQDSSSVTSAPVRLTGRVKWFNNKTGFGFISVVGGNDQFKDASEVFVHHSAITVSQEQYRYLVEGEYVEFSVVTNESGEHKFQAGDVRGVKGGKLFCETRHEHRGATGGRRVGGGGGGASAGGREHSDGHREYQSRGGSAVGRGRGGRSMQSGRGGRGGSEWMLVRRDQQERRDYGDSSQSHTRYRSERSTTSSDQSQSKPAAAASTAAAAAPSVSEDSGKTPRAQTARKPRQAKPSA
jgi:CspA family cold shock protein